MTALALAPSSSTPASTTNIKRASIASSGAASVQAGSFSAMSTRTVSEPADDDRPRKRLRKGTRSCWECKRRKVRCVFKDESDSICVECAVRHSNCVSQEFDEDENSPGNRGRAMRDRVGRLEELVEHLISKVDQWQDRAERQAHQLQALLSDKSNCCPADELQPEVTIYTTPAPVLALFDRPARDLPGHRHHDTALDHDGQHKQSQQRGWTAGIDSLPTIDNEHKFEKVRLQLLDLFPSDRDLATILEHARPYSRWDVLFPLSRKPDGSWLLDEFATRALAKDHHPALIASAMVFLAVVMQEMSNGFDMTKLNLPTIPERMVNRYINAIRALIVCDDELMGSIEGLELGWVLGKFTGNLGMSRTSWVFFRRAINAGLLMGLSRKVRPTTLYKNGQLDLYMLVRARRAWCGLFQADRFTGMLLGLPPALADTSCDMVDSDDVKAFISPADRYRQELAVLAGRMVERAHHMERADASESDLWAMAQELDMKLDNLAATQPAWWADNWSPGSITSGVESDMDESVLEVALQLIHLAIKIMLHIPFIMRSNDPRRFAYSRDSCMKACRGMLDRFLWMRGSYGRHICKAFDFVVFIAAVILLMSCLCSNPHHQQRFNCTPARRAEDWVRVEKTITEMEASSKECGGLIARQSVNILKTLRVMMTNPASIRGDDVKLAIPYFGYVTIAKAAGHVQHIVIPGVPTSQADDNRASYPEVGYPPARQNTTALTNGGPAESSPMPHRQSFSVIPNGQQFPSPPRSNSPPPMSLPRTNSGNFPLPNSSVQLDHLHANQQSQPMHPSQQPHVPSQPPAQAPLLTFVPDASIFPMLDTNQSTSLDPGSWDGRGFGFDVGGGGMWNWVPEPTGDSVGLQWPLG